MMNSCLTGTALLRSARRGVALLALCLFAGVLAFSQTSAASGPGASSDATAGPEGKTSRGNPALVAPTAAVDPHTYKIGAEDILSVRVWREDQLSGLVSVRPDGKISMPLIHDVQAKGLTPIELQEAITKALSEYIKEPDVLVEVRSVQSKRYSIQGEVLKPGTFNLVTPVRVMEALSNCGGFKDFANVKDIRILRGNQTLKFNWKEVSKGKKMEQNIYVEDGDQIIVP